MTLKREDFPSFFKFHANRPRYQERFEETLVVLNNSLEQGSIRNVEFKDVKSRCSDAASEAYKCVINEEFVWNQKFMSLPPALQELEMSINFSGIHSMKSIKKKVDAAKGDHPFLTALKDWVSEYMPLSDAIETLKANVVMGRAPSTEPPKPVNPNKDVKTCACCFRPIAVVAGTMAHHGYKRPGNGFQTNSCPGVRFQPLELSPAGLEHMSKAHGNSIEAKKFELEKAPEKQSFQRKLGLNKTVTVTRDEPRFKFEMEAYVHGIERDIRWHTSDKEMFDTRIKEWKPDMKHKQVLPEEESPSP